MNNGNEMIVGLDLGSNSVGWAVVEMNGDKLERIHGMGSRIIPMGDEKKEFEQGAKITKNAGRRQKRSMRRNNQRYKLRRTNLVKVLQAIGAWPEGLGDPAKPGQRMLSASELYGLRAKAADEAITMEELGRVLYHMNQRRGYKDIGDLMDELQGKEAEMEEKDSKVSREVEEVEIVEVVVEDAKGKKEILRVTLSDGREGTTTSQSFKELVGKKEYIEVKTKRTKKGDTIEFYRTSVTDWLKNKDKLDQAIEDSGLHPGQFFHREFLKDPLNRVRERIVLRERFRSEFDAIWNTQSQAHPALTDSAHRDKVLDLLIPRNQLLRKQWADKDLGRIIKDFVIYYQRPLRSQVKTKGQCRFERKPVMPVSSPVYQLFRIWQQVNNIRLRDRYMKEQELSPAEKNKLVHYLIVHEKLDPERVVKELKRDKEGLETNLRGAIPGHQTMGKLRKYLKTTASWERLVNEAATVQHMEHSLLFRLWHILYSIPEEEHRKSALEGIKDIPAEVVAELAKVRFERKHGAVSARAAQHILPLMVCGDAWSIEAMSERVQRRVQQVIDGRGTEDMKEEMRRAVADLTSLEHYQGLPYWLASTVVYGDHRAKTGAMLQAPDEIKIMPRGFLRNPVVEQVVNEAMMVVRDIWSTYGKPTSFRIELARALRQNQEQRAHTYRNNDNRDRARKKVVAELTAKHGLPKPSRKDIEKYELWEQQKHHCMYSGKPIQAADLFNNRVVDVDHIIPRSLFYDDSLQNKVLCFRSENAGDTGKNNLLAVPFMKAKGQGAYEDYVARIHNLYLPPGKRKYLLAEEVPESFINRQLNETRYIGTEVRDMLQRIAPVNVTLGQVTDALKNEWGLNKVYKEVLRPRFERLERIVGRPLIEELPGRNGHGDIRMEGYDKRIDHRHHALDALVVALTRQGYIQRLAKLKQANLDPAQEEQVKRPTWWPLPHPDLRRMVKDGLERTIPSIKNRQRLVTKAANRTAYLADPEKGVVRKGAKGRKQTKGTLFAVRGALHEEQPLGEVRRQQRLPLNKVLDRLVDRAGKEGPLDLLKPVAKGDPGYRTRLLAHEHERALLHDHLSKYGGDVKAMKKVLRKDPIVNGKNEVVEAMTLLVPVYAVTQAVGSLSGKMLEKVLDTGIRRELDVHISRFDSDMEKALTGDGITQLNDGRPVPLRTVRIKKYDAAIWDTDGHTQMQRPGERNDRMHVRKGENYALAVHVNEETGERQFEVISFYDAVARKLKGQDIVEPRLGFRYFVLRKKDPVYVPRPDEALTQIDWNDRNRVHERLWTTTKFSGSRFYFIPSTVSSVLGEMLEFGSQHCAEFVDADEPRTKIALVCIPVHVDRLGGVSPRWP